MYCCAVCSVRYLLLRGYVKALRNASNQMPSLFQFVLFWTHVAERFADNPYVLGYEIMNEPWCGNTWQEPDLLIPGERDRMAERSGDILCIKWYCNISRRMQRYSFM